MCALRRLDEELGITGVDLTYRDTVEYRADVGGGLIEHEVVDIYLGEMAPGHRFTPNPDEVMDTIWRPLKGLALEVMESPSKFTPWLAIYMRDHASVIFGDTLA